MEVSKTTISFQVESIKSSLYHTWPRMAHEVSRSTILRGLALSVNNITIVETSELRSELHTTQAWFTVDTSRLGGSYIELLTFFRCALTFSSCMCYSSSATPPRCLLDSKIKVGTKVAPISFPELIFNEET